MSLYKTQMFIANCAPGKVYTFGSSNQLWACAQNALNMATGFNEFTFVGVYDPTAVVWFPNNANWSAIALCYQVGYIDTDGALILDVAP